MVLLERYVAVGGGLQGVRAVWIQTALDNFHNHVLISRLGSNLRAMHGNQLGVKPNHQRKVTRRSRMVADRDQSITEKTECRRLQEKHQKTYLFLKQIM
jgi:predicted choloylglycine hydrolase